MRRPDSKVNAMDPGPVTPADGQQREEELVQAPVAAQGPEAARGSRVDSGPRAAAERLGKYSWPDEERSYFGTCDPMGPPIRNG